MSEKSLKSMLINFSSPLHNPVDCRQLMCIKFDMNDLSCCYSVRKLHSYISVYNTEEPVPINSAKSYMQAIMNASERVSTMYRGRGSGVGEKLVSAFSYVKSFHCFLVGHSSLYKIVQSLEVTCACQEILLWRNFYFVLQDI